MTKMKIEYNSALDEFTLNIFKGVTGTMKGDNLAVLNEVITRAIQERDKHIRQQKVKK